MLYRKNRPSEAAHRYQYALKKINPLISDEGLTTPITQPVPHEHVSAFVQLKTNLLLNLSRCKRKLNVSSLSHPLSSRFVSSLRQCVYTGSLPSRCSEKDRLRIIYCHENVKKYQSQKAFSRNL